MKTFLYPTLFLLATILVVCCEKEAIITSTRTEEEVADSTSSEVTISVDYDDGWIINEYSY